MRASTKPTSPHPGKVSTHVITISRATPQLTMCGFLEQPAPTIAAVFVFVVETGSPNTVARSRLSAAESIKSDGPMENHADLVEVRDALAGGVGIDQRESETDGVDYLYVAVPCTYQGELAVVRVSRTMERVNKLMSNYLWVSVGLLVAALVVALITAWLVSRRAVAPVQRLEQVRTDFVANASHELKAR